MMALYAFDITALSISHCSATVELLGTKTVSFCAQQSILFMLLKCLQERKEEKEKEKNPSEFSLHGALFDVMVQNKQEFVYLFMERVNLKKFLDESRLQNLYDKVFKNTVCV